MHYNAVPNVIFTEPEIGTVGYNLEQAIEAGFKATVGAFPFQALGKAQVDFEEWIARERKSEAAESRARGGRFED